MNAKFFLIKTLSYKVYCGKEISEALDYIPGYSIIRRYIRLS